MHLFINLILTFLVLSGSSVNSDELNEYRLTKDITPIHYDINLTPYFKLKDSSNFTFDGIVTIQLLPENEEVSSIRLHKHNEINIKKHILQRDDEVIEFLTENYNKKTEIWTITYSIPLNKNEQYLLSIEFSGVINNDMEGFYRSYYWENGVQKWLGATQMQQTSARRAFPCFDEPGFKSTFQLTINRPNEFGQSLFNTKLESSVKHPTLSDYMVDKFKVTPKMPTYLVSWLISDFKGRENDDNTFGVHASADMFNNTEYPLETGQKILKTLGDYLQQDYYENKMEKLDFTAIPDFDAGAMENWGLVTYRDTRLLYDRDHSTTQSKQKITATISHEVSHMWFGNLVTCEWWSYTWLNEGFGRYFTFFGAQMITDEYDLDLQFVVDYLQVAFQLDSTASTHPLNHNVNTQSEISGMFDHISYHKGGSLLRMIRLTIGNEKFQEMLQVYLEKNKFQSVTPDHLWEALETVLPNQDFRKIFSSWADKAGYPLVTVNLIGNTLHVSQQRFLITEKAHGDQTLYDIPITIATRDSGYTNLTPSFILASKDRYFGLPNTSLNYVILNVQQAGFYRVNYNRDIWMNIKAALYSNNHDNIHVLNRAQIVDDLFNLARPGYLEYDQILEIIGYLKTEKHYIPWQSAFTGLNLLDKRMASKPDEKTFSFYIQDLTKNIYDHLTYNRREDDRAIDMYNRINVLTWNCKYGHKECRKMSKSYFEKYYKDDVAVDPDYRVLVYCTGIREGGQEEFDFLKDRYMKTNFQAEQLNILQGMACTGEQSYSDYLNFILTDHVRPQDKSSAFSYFLSSNPKSYKLAFRYITENYAKWAEVMSITSTLSSVADRFVVWGEIIELKEFVESVEEMFENQYASFVKTISKAEDNLKWDETRLTTFKNHLELMRNQDVNYRLDDFVQPEHYELTITPHFENFTFNGSVIIHLEANVEGVISINLFRENLDITKLTLYKDGKEVLITGEHYNKITNKWTIILAKSMVEGIHTLHIDYSGIIGTGREGLFRSDYWENGKRKWLVATQFQPTKARNVFPCFDEPGFKSTFQLTINRPKEFKDSLSNTKIEYSNVDNLNNLVIEKFKKTPKMSTYLLAFVVSDFDRSCNDNCTFEVYARPWFKNNTIYAVDAGDRILSAIGEYVGYDYYNNSMEKMTMAAIPDLSSGGMENWGLITFGETVLLYDPRYTPTLSKQKITSTISHEISHMWFGNLLTCKWWSYTWLQEGAARYFTYFGTHMIEKEWDMDLQFVVDQVQGAFQLDSLISSKPLSHEVNSKSEISGIFGDISYSKGGSFFRMVKHIIGEDLFQKVLQVYVEKNEFSTVSPEDLWIALEEVLPNKNMKKIFASWTELPGYPLVTAHYTNNTIHVSQKRFLSNQKDHNDSTMYNVPITVASNGSKYDNTEPLFYLMAEDDGIGKEFKLNEKPKDYIIVNVQQAGYYRVNYDKNNWEAIGKALHTENHDNIHVLNRAQIVDDLFNLARVGHIKYNESLEIIDYLKTEIKYAPWASAFNCFNSLAKRINLEKNLEIFSFYILDLTKSIYEHLTYTPRTDDRRVDIYNRINVLTWNCKYGNDECLKQTKKEFDDYRENNSAIEPDYRVLVFCNGIRQGDKSEFEFLMQKYTNYLLPAEQLNILQGLACTKNGNLITKYINFVLTDNVRPQYKDLAVTYIITSNPENYKSVFDYLIENHKLLIQSIDFMSALQAVADRFTNESEIEKLKKFIEFNRNDLENQLKHLNEIVNLAEENLKWDETYLKEFLNYIDNKKNNANILLGVNFSVIILVLIIQYFLN